MQLPLDINDINDYNINKDYIRKGGREEMALKPWTIRMPEEIYKWLMEKAARETIRKGERVSMNTLGVDILTKAMKADKKKGGK